jgi:prophage regulatory protein
MQNTPVELLRLSEVLRRTGKSRSAVYADDSFPQQIKIGKRSVAWIGSEIDQWISDRVNASRSGRMEAAR